jgi:hypothetical protein
MHREPTRLVSCEERREARLDDALDDSFPASEAPAIKVERKSKNDEIVRR